MIKEYGYEYDAVVEKDIYEQTKGVSADEMFWDAICLRSGRDALKAIAREFSPTTVLIPALSCESMISPFELYGHKVCFYRLNSDYEIDKQDLESKIPKKEALFLYMNYFGVESISDEALRNLQEKYKNLYFIEDRTHDLLTERSSTFVPDFTLASLRKWINIPDGGLLWTKKPLKSNLFEENLTFSQTRLKAEKMRNEFFRSGDIALKKEYRKIFSSVSKLLDDGMVPVKMSKYSLEIIKATDWSKIKNVRKQNAQELIDALNSLPVGLIQSRSGLSDLYVAFTTNNRDEIQTKLSSKGIYNTIIWPLSKEQIEICDVAAATHNTMLAAPCDQRYTVSDMKFIGDEIARVLNE